MLTEKTFRPAGTRDCQLAIAVLSYGEPLQITPDRDREGGHVVTTVDGDRIGYLTPRHWVSVDLASDRVVLHASVNCNSNLVAGKRMVTVRVVTGARGDVYAPWTPSPPQDNERLQTPWGSFFIDITGPTRAYKGRIVSLSSTVAIEVGDSVQFQRSGDAGVELQAICVFTNEGERIGSLVCEPDVKRALIDESKRFRAVVSSMPTRATPAAPAMLKIVIEQ